jgi:hypothetical protein
MRGLNLNRSALTSKSPIRAAKVRERPMRCVIALSSLLVQAKLLSDKMDHEDVLRARRLARAIIKGEA